METREEVLLARIRKLEDEVRSLTKEREQVAQIGYAISSALLGVIGAVERELGVDVGGTTIVIAGEATTIDELREETGGAHELEVTIH